MDCLHSLFQMSIEELGHHLIQMVLLRRFDYTVSILRIDHHVEWFASLLKCMCELQGVADVHVIIAFAMDQ